MKLNSKMKNFIILSILAFTMSVLASPVDEAEAALKQKNYALAISKFGDAAASGSSYALVKLKQMQTQNQGQKAEFDVALKKIENAASSRGARSRMVLADAHLFGALVKRDCKLARDLYKELASEGDEVAQHNLGGMYLNGNCVPKDYVLGYMWTSLNLAQANNDNGNEFLTNLEKNSMSRDQVAQAQKMARECLKNKYKNCD
jgi:TPR repeat protein